MQTCDRCSQETDIIYIVLVDKERLCPICAEKLKDNDIKIED